ncbi:hypothetical protein LCGC14_0588040 [marine sediment metagenome]|uniref:Uncharacterized protein n=1 Tax=marine sediment metagenome TaxID=412755 RepID=A0A0F9U0P3_9ZZZZ
MKLWFGADSEDDLPVLPSMNGEHEHIWKALIRVWNGQRRIHTRLARLEALIALGVAVALLALGAQLT